jgi:hypothetical protein
MHSINILLALYPSPRLDLILPQDYEPALTPTVVLLYRLKAAEKSFFFLKPICEHCSMPLNLKALLP